MQNSKRHGRAIDYTVPDSVSVKGGDLIVFPGMVAVAATDGEEGQIIACEAEGVFELPVASGFGSGSIAQGVAVYTTESGDVTPTQDTENPLVRAGVTWAGRAPGETAVLVKINV